MTDYEFPMMVGEEEVSNERMLQKNVQSGTMMNGPESVRFIVIHCSASRADREYTIAQMMRDHKARGFRTIGYHFYIRRNGEVSQHRRLQEAGAHAYGYNRCSIGVCYEGGLDTNGHPCDTRTAEQRTALQSLLEQLHRMYPDAMIVGHRDLPGVKKECPCFNAAAEYGKR